MPFIEEEKFKLMQEDLDNAKLKREESENELNSVNENFTSFKKKSKRTPILLGLLLGLALGASYYLYTNNGVVKTTSTTSSDIVLIKKNESLRILDSVKRAQVKIKKVIKSGVNENNLDSTILNVSENTTGETMYSVQIGVFSKNKYALLSSKTIPSIVNSADGYFKYSLGLFTTLNEAKNLKNELIKIGFKDAFVASYIDGKRQKIHN
ncbi:hypothetical protein CXF68_13900 [Tenacibaculum sp. Bg11-29]|uniref:SPOR domain-containing protein n=1 Tax=Tenacibaculum sp. Bg11-29 TaxID=2058306 RepID=UPI000C344C8F|nr:SPOR domain-containing protein [Tenacibaculum sp. Bg11-29]PKH51710.1 hypothetical protein CXF68_13900 [Tenacibaculum sp. Bg11-29]